MRSLPRVWLCADVEVVAAAELVARTRDALRSGPSVVWLRSPQGWPAGALARLASSLMEVVHGSESLLLVGDRVDVALAVGAHGVHLAERSLAATDARRLIGAGALISQAVHDAAGVERARDAVDAMVLSPFGMVAGKGLALGAEGFVALRSRAPDVFTVALGGVTDADVARAARAAGADAVAVRRALLNSDDPAEAVASLRRAMS